MNRWLDRPQKDDKIALVSRPDITGRVIKTFYQNGEGGTHVEVTDGVCTWASWAHYSSLRVTERAAPMPERSDDDALP